MIRLKWAFSEAGTELTMSVSPSEISKPQKTRTVISDSQSSEVENTLIWERETVGLGSRVAIWS